MAKTYMTMATPPVTNKSQEISSDFSRYYYLKKPIYTFQDVVLPDETIDSIKNALAAVEYHDLVFNNWGLGKTIKRGRGVSINFYGASGTGKTMTAHAVANSLNTDIMQVNYAEIESKYVGETAKNLTTLFDLARSQKSVLLFDEADALLSRRVTDMRNSTDVSVNQTRSVLLMLLDEYEGVVIFTTNFIGNFDPAFMRRISDHIHFPLPNIELRKRLWRSYIPAEMPTNMDIAQIATKFDEVSGSDIMSAVLAASLKAARIGAAIIEQQFFEMAMHNIVAGRSANARSTFMIEESIVSREYVEEEIGITKGDK